MTLSFGQYYPRIGPRGWPYQETVYYKHILSAQRQLELLCRELDGIFTFVEPVDEHRHVYSHRLRNLLIVAATEFEAQCVGILEANGVGPNGHYFNTTDYIRLLPVFQLDQYRIGLSMFPSYPSLGPFEGWSASNPTTSLPWYDAYNKTKHNRESNFGLATIENALQAVGACFCMYMAQVFVGNQLMCGVGEIFSVIAIPRGDATGTFRIRCGDTPTAVNYPF